MKINKYLFSLTLMLALASVNISAKDYQWSWLNSGPNYNSPEELCAASGGVPSYPITGPGGWYGCWGVCYGSDRGPCFVRWGDSCPTGKQYHGDIGTCEDTDPPPKDPGIQYTPNKDCPSGIWDHKANACVPLQDCPEGQIRDKETKQCVPKPEECPDGQIRDENGQCVPEPEKCPDGQVKDESGQCVPEPCPEGQIRGEDGSCKPECPSGTKKDKVTGLCTPDCSAPKDNTGQCNPAQDPRECGGSVGNPILISTGQKVELVTDIAIVNSALSFERNYWSTRLDISSVGLSWQHNWRKHIQQLTHQNQVKVYRGDGRGLTFTPLANGQWQAPLGSDVALVSLSNNGWKILESGNMELYNNKGQLVSYSVKGYPLITLKYNDIGQLISLQDESRNSLTISYDETGLITQVTTNQGLSVDYSYDEKYRLVGVTKYGKTKQYHYEDSNYPNALTGVTDERGIRYVTWIYNDKGQAISSENAGGANKYQLQFLDNNRTRVINPLGGSTIYHFQNFLLKREIIRVEGEATGTCVATNAIYSRDYKGLLTNTTNKNGATTTYEYNDRGLETVRKFSGKSLKYNVYTKWHDILPLPTVISRDGQSKSFQYDSEGRLIELTNGFKDLSEVNKGQDVALLQFNDFTDEAGNSWEKVGDPQLVDDPEAVTGKALYLDGNSYLATRVDKFQFGTGDFTIEFRAKVRKKTSATTPHNFVHMWNSATPDSSIGIYAMNTSPVGAIVYHAFQSAAIGQVHGYPNNLNVLDGKWHHIAYVRKNNVLTVYYDGISRLTLNDPITYQFDPDLTMLKLGSSMEGYLDQVRISKHAIYTENFAPSRERFELNNHKVENNVGKDVALLQFNDFTDDAGNVWTQVGNPQLVDDPEAIGGKALYIDTDSYLTTSIEKFQFGTGDFTIEFWVKLNPRTSSSKYGFLTIWNSDKPDSSLRVYSMNSNPVGVLVYHAYQSGSSGQVHGYPANLNVIDNSDWHHIAYVRKDNVLTLYYDGASRLTIKDPINYQFYPEATTLNLGATIDGYLDQVRISKRAIYTGSFTPSREPYVLNDGVTE